MLIDPELSALLDQAARNLDTLELLARSAKEEDLGGIEELQRRLEKLRAAYTSETDALTHEVLRRAVERRRTPDRRRPPVHEVELA
jgi:hypothetical protein